MPNLITKFAFAWIIIVGGLMLTPNGVFCIACNPFLKFGLAIITILVGVVGAFSAFSNRSVKER